MLFISTQFVHFKDLGKLYIYIYIHIYVYRYIYVYIYIGL